jgi:hypothetical protein
MRWGLFSLPPIMERSLRDDLKWAVCFLVGATAGYFVLGADDPGLLLGALVGCTVMILVLGALRRVRRAGARKRS